MEMGNERGSASGTGGELEREEREIAERREGGERGERWSGEGEGVCGGCEV
jgi:hypothetical protein